MFLAENIGPDENIFKKPIPIYQHFLYEMERLFLETKLRNMLGEAKTEVTEHILAFKIALEK